MLTGYYVAQDFIMARLLDKVSGVSVFPAYTFADVQANSQISPAIHVLIDGEEHDPGGYGGTHTVKQRWLIITVVNNPTDQRGLSARQQADPIVLAAAQALAGWRPSDDHGAMTPASPPPCVYIDGIGYFSLLYTSDIEIIGSA